VEGAVANATDADQTRADDEKEFSSASRRKHRPEQGVADDNDAGDEAAEREPS
jgi:hypothetical protein